MPVTSFSLPMVAKCADGEMYLDTAYAGIQFRQRGRDTLVLSQGRPRVYLLGKRGNSLKDVTGQDFR